MSDDYLGEGKASFKKPDNRKGFKGYWFVLLLVVIGSATLYAGVEFRKVLPPLPIFVKEAPPADVPSVANSGAIELN